jgi:colicin import membrane protein
MRLTAWLRNEADAEPIPVGAGVVAVALHAVFIGALFMSMNWQQKALSRATVKIWHALPLSRPQGTPPEAARRRVTPPKVKAVASSVEPAISAPPVAPPKVQPPPATVSVPTPPPAAVAPPPAKLPAPATPPLPVATASPPVTPPPVAPATPPAAQALPPAPVPPAPQTSPSPSPPLAEPTVDVEAQRREKALALAERLREEENSPANDALDREREARRAALEKRRVERERDLARKLQEVAAAAEKGRAEEQTEEAAGAQTQALIDQYRARISAKVRQRVVLPPDLHGNPEAVYEVTLLPGGEVVDVRLRKSSGMSTLDASVQRAILAAQPLPVPNDPELFDLHFRKFLLNFRPKQ